MLRDTCANTTSYQILLIENTQIDTRLGYFVAGRKFGRHMLRGPAMEVSDAKPGGDLVLRQSCQ